MTRNRLLIGAALLIALAAPIGWYLLSPLFIDRVVDEEFPAAQAAPAATAESEMMAAEAETMVAATAESEMMAAATMESEMMAAPTAAPEPTRAPAPTATPAPPTATPQPTPAPPTATPSEPIVLLRGTFHPVEHRVTGTATVYQLPDGRRILRLEEFTVDNGPDLFVWLSSAPDADDARTILDSQYVELARLKGNQGNQNYELPADLDLANIGSVTIWCRQFSVNFATAALR